MWECEHCGRWFHPDDVVHDENGEGEYCCWECANSATHGGKPIDEIEGFDEFEDEDFEDDLNFEEDEEDEEDFDNLDDEENFDNLDDEDFEDNGFEENNDDIDYTSLEYVPGTEEYVRYSDFNDELQLRISEVEDTVSLEGVPITIVDSEKAKLKAFREEAVSITLQCTMNEAPEKSIESAKEKLEQQNITFNENNDYITFDIEA